MPEDDIFNQALKRGHITRRAGGRLQFHRKPCKWCAGGNMPDEKGEHWIVRSLIRAKIDIRKCANWNEIPDTPT